MKTIDLHVHSNISDGELSPREIVEKAVQNQMDIISITDHDYIDSYESLEEEYKITILPGIEINTAVRNLHLLGYCMTNFDDLMNLIMEIKQDNEKVCLEVIKLLQSDFYDISEEKVRDFIKRIHAKDDVLDKRKLVKYLLDKGYAKSVLDAYRSLIGVGQKYYIPIRKIDPIEVINLIRSGGGYAVLAHPRSLNLDQDSLRELILNLEKNGLYGVEIENINNQQLNYAYYDGLLKDTDLLCTFGSDFHSKQDPFGVDIEEKYYSEIEKRLILQRK